MNYLKNIFPKILIITSLVIFFSALIYLLISKNIIHLTYKESLNPFKSQFKSNSSFKITHENLTQNIQKKLTEHFISSIVYFDPKTETLKIKPEMFSPTTTQQLSKEIANKIFDNIILDIQKDYSKVINNLKIQPTNEKITIDYTNTLINFYNSFKNLFEKTDAIYVFQNFKLLEDSFQKLIMQPVPEKLKDEHLKMMKKLIVIKNSLKYIYSLDDPLKMIAGMEFIRNLDDKTIDNLFQP